MFQCTDPVLFRQVLPRLPPMELHRNVKIKDVIAWMWENLHISRTAVFKETKERRVQHCVRVPIMFLRSCTVLAYEEHYYEVSQPCLLFRIAKDSRYSWFSWFLTRNCSALEILGYWNPQYKPRKQALPQGWWKYFLVISDKHAVVSGTFPYKHRSWWAGN